MAKRWRDMTPRERDARGSTRWKAVRAAVLKESDICWLCGRPGATTVDHIIRVEDGGTSDRENLRPAHGPKQPWGCPGNFGRGDRTAPLPRTSRDW